jgi:hypothetical protein
MAQEHVSEAQTIEIDALRQLGDMLQATDRATGGQPYQSGSTGSILEPVENNTPTLADENLQPCAETLCLAGGGSDRDKNQRQNR